MNARPKIKKFRLSQLSPAKYNPRKISDEALEGLSNSLKRFGIVEPIIVNVRDGRNTIVGGHQRRLALQKLSGADTEIDCIVVDLDEAEEKLLNLSLNNPAIQGEFVDEIQKYIDDLRTEIQDEQAFLDLRIDQIRGEIVDTVKEGLTDDDAIPEPPKKAKTKTGDLYILGGEVKCPKCGKIKNI
jgi:hypothetical protein